MKRELLVTFIIGICMGVSPITAAAAAGEDDGAMEMETVADPETAGDPADVAEPGSDISDADVAEPAEPDSDAPAAVITNSDDALPAEEAAIDCADPSSGGTGGNEIAIDVNSGAPRGADFISVNETVQTDAGDFDLIMYGLKVENKDAVITALEENYDPTGSEVLKLVDAAFADAEKYSSIPLDQWNSYDSNQCWAASAANMLWMSGWAEGLVNPLTNAPFTSEDDIFVFFNENFSDKGAEVSAGINWFFTGEFYNSGYTGAKAILLRPKDPDNGLMKEFASMQVQERLDLIENSGDIARLADCDWTSETPAVFQASIGELYEGKITRSQHSVTVAGIVLDAVAETVQDIFKSILIINSDNDAAPSEAAAAIEDPTKEQKNEDKAARPNSVSVYNLAYIQAADGTPCWQLLGYDSEEPEILYALNRLPLYSRELLGQNTETEGTKNIVDNVDLKFGTVFTTGETERIVDLYGKDEKELTKTEFQQGEPVNVNYFVANMGSNILTETYTDGKPLTVDWKVVRDADGEVVAQGQDSCALPIYYGIELGFMSHLNQADGELQVWKPGTYTLYLDLNADRNVAEAYYLNNVQKEMTFTIAGEEDPEEAEPEKPEEQEDAKPDKPGDEADEGEAKRPDDLENDGQTESAGITASASNKTAHSGSPKTGDSHRTLVWLIMALLAALAGVQCSIIRYLRK